FMVSTTFTKESRIGIDLPKADREPQEQVIAADVEIVIDAQGNYKVDGQLLINNSVQSLRTALTPFLENKDQQPAIVISADAQAAHQYIVTVMDVAGQLGLNKIKISTLKEQAE
ncbi:MAG: ExbD/TolR family protein, partial [Pseudomonadales bacterium]